MQRATVIKVSIISNAKDFIQKKIKLYAAVCRAGAKQLFFADIRSHCAVPYQQYMEVNS
jgi:hypothetical protein